MASLSPPPLLGRETKKYSLREKADAPPAGPWGGRWVVICGARMFYQGPPCQQDDISWSPWAVVRRETEPTAELGGSGRGFYTSLI